MDRLRSELYYCLADALATADLPEWLAQPGREWPLYECICGLAGSSEAARLAVCAIGKIPGEPLARRKARYTALFCGPGRPRCWLYESVACSGRVLGPETLSVEKWYRSAGFEMNSAELPDHASAELAFLAILAGEGSAGRELERAFIIRHAGRWLPDLGRELKCTGDKVYGPVGELLTEWLEETAWPGKKLSGQAYRVDRQTSKLPVVHPVEKCSLCGFCAQVCPTHALSIRENAFSRDLILSPAACILCRKCELVCEFEAIQILPQTVFVDDQHSSRDLLILRRSSLKTCRICGSVIASQAELEYLNQQLGFPDWLDICPDCRAR
jgi:TorA maturation chaperone TorD